MNQLEYRGITQEEFYDVSRNWNFDPKKIYNIGEKYFMAIYMAKYKWVKDSEGFNLRNISNNKKKSYYISNSGRPCITITIRLPSPEKRKIVKEVRLDRVAFIMNVAKIPVSCTVRPKDKNPHNFDPDNLQVVYNRNQKVVPREDMRPGRFWKPTKNFWLDGGMLYDNTGPVSFDSINNSLIRALQEEIYALP